jgi:hypothetical protein
MIYIDQIGHMISDVSLDELYAFAQKLRLKRKWFQSKPGYEHYDLTTSSARQRALFAGAKRITAQELVRMQPGYKEKQNSISIPDNNAALYSKTAGEGHKETITRMQ